MDPLQQVKREIEEMLSKSFADMALKRELNEKKLTQLKMAAENQKQQIDQLQRGIDELQRTSGTEGRQLEQQLHNREDALLKDFSKMMSRLTKIEENISEARINLQDKMKSDAEVQQSVDVMLSQMEKIEREQRVPVYTGDRNQLHAEIEDFERMIGETNERMRGAKEGVELAKKTLAEPLNSLQARMALHNDANEKILRERLKDFTNRMEQVEKRVIETMGNLNNEVVKTAGEQQRVLNEMNLLEQDLLKLRGDLESAEDRRKDSMHKSAANLDQIVEDMLAEARALQIKVQSLKKNYEAENQKLVRGITPQRL